jgi:hypothetical protein
MVYHAIEFNIGEVRDEKIETDHHIVYDSTTMLSSPIIFGKRNDHCYLESDGRYHDKK